MNTLEVVAMRIVALEVANVGGDGGRGHKRGGVTKVERREDGDGL